LDGIPLKTVGSQDNGSSLTLQTGDSLQIRLPENPTTGYRWQLADWDEAVAKKTRDQFFPPATAQPGAGGERVWEFVANAPGKTVLRLDNRRSWEAGSPAQTFSLKVQVI
jgi:inhibitor of cysteine peptidase